MSDRKLLVHLGITPNYKGFYLLLSALELLRSQPKAILSVTKQLYPAIADMYNLSWKTVERDLRTIVSRAWDCNVDMLRKVAGFPIICCPTVAQFLAILVER